MKEIQSYDGFERALKASKTPSINPDTIKIKIHEYEQSRKSKSLSRKLIPILIPIVVLLLGTVVFGDTLNNILFNKKGEKVYEYGIPVTKDEQSEILKKDEHEPLLKKLKEEAIPGELTVLVFSDEYKVDRRYYPIQTLKPVYNIDDIINSTITKFKSPVSKDITFKEGSIYFKAISQNSTKDFDSNMDNKYKEAIDKGLEYIVWTEPLGKVAQDINLKYTINKIYSHGKYTQVGSTLSIRISREMGVSGNSIIPENASKIKIGDSEGIFVDTAQPEIIYVDDSTGERLTYHFNFKDSSLKDVIISLIENMQ